MGNGTDKPLFGSIQKCQPYLTNNILLFNIKLKFNFDKKTSDFEMQVLKEEVRNRILAAAEKIFYEQDYRSAKLTDIADEADIPVECVGKRRSYGVGAAVNTF